MIYDNPLTTKQGWSVNKMDWNNEVSNLKKGMDFVKLDAGIHKIKFLNEGTIKETTYQNEKKMKVFFEIEKDGTQYIWSVMKSSGLNSAYGQIALLGRKYGCLTGRTFDLMVKGSGKEKDYTFMEAIELGKLEDERRKANTVKTEQVA